MEEKILLYKDYLIEYQEDLRLYIIKKHIQLNNSISKYEIIGHSNKIDKAKEIVDIDEQL